MTQNLIKPISVYKKFNSILEIDTIEIPAIQRTLNRPHVDELKTHIYDFVSKSKEPIFGTVDLAFYNHKYWAVDGQHRLKSLQEIYSESKIIIPVHALIYNVSSDEELEEIFKIRNKAIPISKFIAEEGEKKKQLLKDIMEFLTTDHKNIFRYDRTKRPYVHIEYFIEHFRTSKLYSVINNMNEFVSIFNMLNQYCFNKVNTMTDKEKRKYTISKAMIDLWTVNGIFIGYDYNFEIFSEEFDITPFLVVLKK